MSRLLLLTLAVLCLSFTPLITARNRIHNLQSMGVHGDDDKPAAAATETPAAAASSGSKDICSAKVNGNTVQLNGPGTAADGPFLSLGVADNVYGMGVNQKGKFFIDYGGKTMLEANPAGLVIDSLQAKTIVTENFVVGDMPQFKLVHHDIFTSTSPTDKKVRRYGWNIKGGTRVVSSPRPDTLSCNGLTMLTTPPAPALLSKRYKSLPKHTFVRVTATVHFVDDWQGETAFLKINGNYVWTDTLDQRARSNQISVCGRKQYPETRFTQNIDVSIPHTNSSISLSFGTNQEQGSDMVFGVSNIAISTRL